MIVPVKPLGGIGILKFSRQEERRKRSIGGILGYGERLVGAYVLRRAGGYGFFGWEMGSRTWQGRRSCQWGILARLKKNLLFSQNGLTFRS